ncbi:integral membrane protein DUF106 [Nitzschia inconspicua]|uniref:Integral membrane protein DUF106 n=1 Tax=Nitzschia inconspicua TaxID=303405 RepID=A0A9K3PDS9_9STRA|nr:integral membrane protein DUF106 [Nitzschia inconspicua]
MTCSEILNIVTTVAISQLIIDLLSNYFVFKGRHYTEAVRQMERAKAKVDRAEYDMQRSNSKNNPKKLELAKEEYSLYCADVARRHMMPNMIGSLFFLLLLKILGTEYKGKVIGVLPFVPYTFVSRITARGLDWKDVSVEDLKAAGTTMDPKQALSFMLVYILAGWVAKSYVKRAVGTNPPPGADGGLQTIANSPMGQAMAKRLGFDPDEMKLD